MDNVWIQGFIALSAVIVWEIFVVTVILAVQSRRQHPATQRQIDQCVMETAQRIWDQPQTVTDSVVSRSGENTTHVQQPVQQPMTASMSPEVDPVEATQQLPAHEPAVLRVVA